MEQAWKNLIQKLIRCDVLRSRNVIRALHKVPREPFVPDNVKNQAAIDSPLPIGEGQTASAPLS